MDGKSPKEIGGVPLTNFGGEDFGPTSLTDALTHSVNTVWGTVGEKVGKRTMYEYMRRYGFNRKPLLDLPRDEMRASGVYDGGDLLRVSDAVDIGRVAIGQERLQVTPLQMALVAAAIANGGSLMRPDLVREIRDRDGRVVRRMKPSEQSEVMKPSTASQLAANDEQRRGGGDRHGSRARGHQRGGQDRYGRGGDANQAWFIAFAPVQRPAHRDRGHGRAHHRPGWHRGGADREAGHAGAAAVIAEGTVIDCRYRVLRKIGAGGMADVYCAEDTHLGRNVALKLLHARFAQDQEFVERFRREASSAAGLQHPNVVGVYDRGEFDGTYYIAMEYCEGQSLKEIVAAHTARSGARDRDREADAGGGPLRASPQRDPP